MENSKTTLRSCFSIASCRCRSLIATESDHGHRFTIKTSALTLTYIAREDGRFTPEDLTIELTVDGKPVTWHPGLADDQNLQGTTRTLDGALGDKTKEPIEEGPGLALRMGRGRRLVASAVRLRRLQLSRTAKRAPGPGSWSAPRATARTGTSSATATTTARRLAITCASPGRIPLPPRFAFGTWWSRYWAYSDQEIEEIIRGFHENDVPLDVFVIDMDWHLSGEQLEARGEKDQSGHRLGWTGYTWNKLLFPDPDQFLAKLHARSSEDQSEPASGIGHSAVGRALSGDGAGHGHRSGQPGSTSPSTSPTRNSPPTT